MPAKQQSHTPPRWDHPEDYDYTKTHTVRDWGFEFVRRNPRYIAQWEKQLKDFNEDREFYEDWSLSVFLRNDPAELYYSAAERTVVKEDPHYSDDASKNLELIDEADEEEIQKIKKLYYKKYNLNNPKDYKTFQLAGCHENLWGMITYQDPNAQKLVGSNLLNNEVSTYANFERRHYVPQILMYEGDCVAVFNIKYPLASQISAVEKRLAAYQKTAGYKNMNKRDQIKKSRQKAPEGELWKKYIRCLDAKKAGATRKVAAWNLFKNISNQTTPELKWDETMKQAKDMVENGYRALMWSGYSASIVGGEFASGIAKYMK